MPGRRPRTSRARLQALAGDAGRVAEYVQQTDTRHRSPGWYFDPADGGARVFLGFHERDAFAQLVRLLDRQAVA